MARCIPSVHEVIYNNKTILLEHKPVEDESLWVARAISLSSFVMFSLFVTGTNSALVIGLKKTNKKLNTPQKLYVYLSVTDSFVGTICLPFFFVVNILSLNNCTTQSIAVAIIVYSFGVGLGTFLVISVLRNIAIRKPFHNVKKLTICVTLAGLNLLALMSSVLTFFTYYPKYTSTGLYSFYWLYIGLILILEVSVINVLNLWSRRILSRVGGDVSGTEQCQRRKRNLKAVAVLNKISIVYTCCTLPVGLYYISLSILLLIYKDNKHYFLFWYAWFAIFHLPVFLCSGFNAMVYMFNDKKIKRFYSCGRFCSRRNSNTVEMDGIPSEI